MNFNWKKITHVLFLGAAASLFAMTLGCDKDDDDTPRPPAGSGKVALLNAAFGKDSLHLFVDGEKVTTKLLEYGDSLKYVTVDAGDYSFELKDKENKSVVKKTFKTEKDKNYSILATNSKAGDKFELVQVADDLTAPKSDKAKVRFIHLSPDAAKLNLTSGDTKLAENIAYKSASPFKEIDAEETSFSIVDAEAADTLLTISDFNVTKGKIYTIWVSGLQEVDEDDDTKLKARIFTNK